MTTVSVRMQAVWGEEEGRTDEIWLDVIGILDAS